ALYHACDVVDLVGMVEMMMAHARSGRELHLAFLHVEAGVREQVIVAGMVIMHMRGDHMLDITAIDPDAGKPRLDRGNELADAPRTRGGVEAGIAYDRCLIVAYHRYIVVDRHRMIVRITTDEIVRSGPIVAGIFQRKDFVSVAHLAPALC